MNTNGDMRTTSGGTVRIPREQVERLRKRLRGQLLMPGDAGYEEARRVWNGLIDRRPALIARCADGRDVSSMVEFARDHEVLFSLRGGGHNVAGSAVPVGLVSATGIAGLTLHGGLGWLTRRYGMSVDNLESVDLVTAEGTPIRAGSAENADLFWALKGGGGNFGAVTAFEFRAHPVGPKVWFAAPIYPLDRASEVLAFFRQFMSTAPESLGAVAVYWSAPAIPQVPREQRGVPAVMLLACYSGAFEQGEAAIEPLRHIGKPLADLSAPMDFLEVQRYLDEDYPNGGLYYWKSIYLEELSDEAIAALSSYSAVRPSTHSSIDLWALGGALSRPRNDGGPLAVREAPYLLGIEANWHDPADSAANIAWARELHRDMQRFSTGATYLNFPGFVEEGGELLRSAYSRNYRRMQQIKGKYDPRNIFRGQVPIEPLESTR